ncbi:MAG TPA: periplasmic heavy metal sensor [Anaeromyxobacteraceae bacterium]|nr:periplasmic heavy metal sensor [Anaeromyxobacteraceae bacterium]
MLTVFLSVVITLFVLGVLRLARRAAWRRRRWAGPSWMVRRLSRRLSATPAQERVLAEEVEALRAAVADLRNDLFTSREDLAQALAADHFDPAALDVLGARGASRLDDLRKRLAASLTRVHEALDARQRQMLAELIRCAPHRYRAHGHA